MHRSTEYVCVCVFVCVCVRVDFRKLVCQIAGALPVLAMTPVSAAAAALARSNLRSIVVFVSQNRVSQTALEIACSLAK